jgi:hypothetical protein
VTVSGIVTPSRLLQPRKASEPILVRPLGIVTLIIPVHRINARFPILVTPLEIVTLVIEVLILLSSLAPNAL